jgi:U3 small nucleolar RNA-associated protein 20
MKVMAIASVLLLLLLLLNGDVVIHFVSYQWHHQLLLLLGVVGCCNLVQVAEAKEVAAFAGKYKEAKRCRAYEAYQNLAAALTFPAHLDLLLRLVRDKLPAATSPTIRSKLERLLMAASRGLGYNPSVTAEGLVTWIGIQLEACLKVEEAARAKVKAAVGAATLAASNGHGCSSSSKRLAAAAAAAGGDAREDEEAAALGEAAGDGRKGAEANGEADGSVHLYLLSHFCLTLLNSSLKKGVLAGRDSQTLLLLDPLLPLLVRALYSRHLGTVQVRAAMLIRSLHLAKAVVC